MEENPSVEAKNRPTNSNEIMTKSRTILIVTSTSCLAFLIGFQFSAYAAYYVVMTQHFDVSKTAAGWIGSIQFGLGGLVGVFFAPVLEKYGNHPQLALWGLLMFISLMLSACAVNIFMMYVTYGILLGTAVGISALCVVVELQQRFNKHRVQAFAAFMTAISIGNIVSGYCLGLLIETFGWRGAMCLNAALMLHSVASSLLLSIANGKPSKIKRVDASKVTDGKTETATDTKCYHGKQFLSTFSLLCSDFDLALFSVIRLLSAIISSGVLNHMSLRAVDNNMTLIQATRIVGFVYVVLLISRLVTAVINLFQRISNIFLAAVCAIVGGLALAVSCSSDEYFVWMICYTIYALLYGYCTTTLPALLPDVCGKQNIARKQAVITFFESIGIIAGTPLVGFVFDVSQNYNVAFLFISSLILLCGLLLFLTFYRYRKRQRHLLTVK